MQFGIGIIPAYAGLILALHKRNVEIQDHPRIRGTNEFLQPLFREQERIIPAYAGLIVLIV